MTFRSRAAERFKKKKKSHLETNIWKKTVLFPNMDSKGGMF